MDQVLIHLIAGPVLFVYYLLQFPVSDPTPAYITRFILAGTGVIFWAAAVQGVREILAPVW